MRLLYEIDGEFRHCSFKETLEYAISLFPSLKEFVVQGKSIELVDVLRETGHDNKPCWTLYLECN
jgi:hypothetical protein